MSDAENEHDVPESHGDELAALIRNEVGNQFKAMRQELMPNGVLGLMGEIVDQVAERIIPTTRQMIREELPVIDTDAIAQKTLELARSSMNQEAEKIGAQIEAKASGANGSGMGPGGPTNGGHDHDHDGGDGDDKTAVPAGYAFAKVSGASDFKQAVRMQVGADPLGIVNMVFDKVFMSMEKWVTLHKPNDVTVLSDIQRREPLLFNMYIPNPWGPEFQRMQMETWNTALKMKTGTQPGSDPGPAFNPFVPGAPPNAAYKKESDAQRQPLFGGPGSVTGSGAQPTAVTTPVYATPSDGPKSMAEMMAGDL